MKTSLIVALTLALAGPLAANAQEKKTPSPSGVAAQPAPAKPAATTAAAATSTASASEVRDWAKIDTNRDNLISPEEMQKYLDESWAARKK